MKKLIIAKALLISFVSYGQTAEELNKESLTHLGNNDVKKAFPLIKKAAELGQREAQYNYGYFYQQGIEVAKSDSLANYWFLKSAEQGFISAQFKIAYSYATGRGIKKDASKAFYWTRECSKQGDPECISNLVGCFTSGFGVEANQDSALYWTKICASLPDVEDLQMSGYITNSRITLAIRYLNGTGVIKDKVEAYKWFLIYNESKRDFSILDQQSNIDRIKELESSLSEQEKQKGKIEAESQIKRGLKNLSKLYQTEM